MAFIAVSFRARRPAWWSVWRPSRSDGGASNAGAAAEAEFEHSPVAGWRTV